MNINQYLSAIGKKGGKAKSREKLAAARANGKLGGRPKKPKRVAPRISGRIASASVRAEGKTKTGN